MLYLRWWKAFVGLTHQSRFTGKGSKPPKGALVKSHGIERLGIAEQSRTPVIIFVSKICTMSAAGINRRDERK